MKFHALFPVREEADILGQCLDRMLKWADAIYVFDTGSVDQTWEIVQDVAKKDKRIVPLKKDPVFFSEGHLRGWVFHQARKNMRNGDWFLRVDADEFHHILPPDFVKTRMSKHETIAWYQYYNFQLTESEVKAWEKGEETIADRQRPIEERRRWFTSGAYTEPRLCRYRETMQWPPNIAFPFNSGFVARERLPIRHYPHRDPPQMERRCRLRALSMANKENWARGAFVHWAEQEWRKYVVADHAADLLYWHPGTSLPEYHFTNHLAKDPKRAMQWFMQAFCLPIADRLRPRWPEGTYPQKISDDDVAMLERELRV